MVDRLKEYERTMKDASSLKRVMAVHFVMEGYQGLEVAVLLNVHRQSVSTYVNHFNQGGHGPTIGTTICTRTLSYLSKQKGTTIVD